MTKFTNEPSTVSTLHYVIGIEAARLLMRPCAYGGRTLDVPKGKTGLGKNVFVAICKVIGVEATQSFCKHFGGTRIYVPKDSKSHLDERNRSIVNKYNQGAGMDALVAEFGLSDRRIRSILKETDMTVPPSA